MEEPGKPTGKPPRSDQPREPHDQPHDQPMTEKARKARRLRAVPDVEPASNVTALPPGPMGGAGAAPTTDQEVAAAIERMAGLGLSPHDMALILGRPRQSLDRFAEAMLSGQAKANYRVANAMFLTAVDRTHPRHATMAIFWAKARMGWRGEVDQDALDPNWEPGIANPKTDPDPLTDDAVSKRFEEAMAAFRNAAG